MTLEHLMALTVTNDHAAQERVWNELPEWRKQYPNSIRAALTQNEITAEDVRVRFVTVKDYEKAGGVVRRDLFSEGDEGVYIEDAVLLERLVGKKLEKAANAVRKEGWKWLRSVRRSNLRGGRHAEGGIPSGLHCQPNSAERWMLLPIRPKPWRNLTNWTMNSKSGWIRSRNESKS